MFTVEKHFDSITDIPRFISEHQRARQCGSSSMEPGTHDWDNGLNLNRAIDVAARGGYWAEGAKMLMAAKYETDTHVQRMAPELDYDVSGHTLDVDQFVLGLPEQFITGDEHDDDAIRPILRIGVHVGRNAACDAETIINRGAAIMSLVDYLESEGNTRCEIIALWGNESGGNSALLETTVKRAEDSWSPNSVAFALAHPAFSRRLMFRVAESYPELQRLTIGYGSSISARLLRQRYDLFFARQSGGFETPEIAMDLVMKTALPVLEDLEKARNKNLDLGVAA